MMFRYTIFFLPLLCLIIISSCDNSSGPQVCTSEAEPAIEVQITDATTGRFIAKDAKGVIQDGSYEDSLRHATITQTVPKLIVSSLTAGAERAGTYQVKINLEGYESWTRMNIKVPEGECGPKTQFLRVRLREIEQ